MTAAPGEPHGGSAPLSWTLAGTTAARAQQELIYSAPQQSKLAVLSSGPPRLDCYQCLNLHPAQVSPHYTAGTFGG